MFTPIIRFTLLILCIIAASIGFSLKNTPVLVIASVVSLSLLWGYYKLGTVYLALNKMRKSQYTDAEAIIDMTKKPQHLLKSRRAYYYYIKAYLAREKDDFATAKPLFETALDLGLSLQHDRAIALLALADIALTEGSKDQARGYLERMKSLKVQASLMPHIRQMQAYLAQ